MKINVSYLGSKKPDPPEHPFRPVRHTSLPFGKPNPVNWMTGKHLSLSKEKPVVAVASVVDSTVWEWDCKVSGVIVTVHPADVHWSTRVIPASMTEDTPPVIALIPLDFTSVPKDETRWVYAQINFAANTLTAGVTATSARALDEPGNMISRVNLVCWKKSSDTALAYVATAHKGGIRIGGELAPPMT